MILRLDQLPYRTLATVTGVDWPALTPTEARRLRNLGLDEGVKDRGACTAARSAAIRSRSGSAG